MRRAMSLTRRSMWPPASVPAGSPGALRAPSRRWLQANPNDELANEVRALLTTEPVRHVTYTREYLGWGVFALMAR